jgi:hypothetical protein
MSWIRMPLPFTIEPGRTYAALIGLSMFQKAFASDRVITQKLIDAGFSSVSVMMTRSELDPEMQALDPSDGPWAIATWLGPQQAASSLPSEIKAVWIEGP